MPSRKEFLQIGSAGLLGMFAHRYGAFASEYSPAVQQMADGEVDWTHVQSEFDLKPEITFLNNGTMGPSPRSVVRAYTDRIQEINSTGHYGGGDHECVAALAALLGANKEEIALTHNVTEGINIAAWGVPLKKGDEVILSTHEHVGNAGPWLNLARLKGVKITVCPLGKDAEDTLRLIKKHVSKRTRVIAVPHIPCTIGQVLPVKEMCAWARENNIYTVVDGAHGTGMLKMDLHDMGCDVYVSCCHKWLLGPKGTGYMYVREEFLKTLESLQTGGYSAEEWVLTEKEVSFKGLVPTAHKYYYGTQSAAQYYGVIAAVEFHQKIGPANIEMRIRALNNYLFAGLKDLKKLKILTPEEEISRCGVVSFKFDKYDDHQFFEDCQKEKIVIRFVGENNLNCVRVSTHIYNSEDQIDKFLNFVKSKV
ncbi:MAG: aminotransferase class V-fold PLP-dependent enzyme [Bacteroidetes bacterium]|nr:aminotransferase class V-fold PLP-dependent enzyme [Bacteroidota bacterium]